MKQLLSSKPIKPIMPKTAELQIKMRKNPIQKSTEPSSIIVVPSGGAIILEDG